MYIQAGEEVRPPCPPPPAPSIAQHPLPPPPQVAVPFKLAYTDFSPPAAVAGTRGGRVILVACACAAAIAPDPSPAAVGEARVQAQGQGSLPLEMTVSFTRKGSGCRCCFCCHHISNPPFAGDTKAFHVLRVVVLPQPFVADRVLRLYQPQHE